MNFGEKLFKLRKEKGLSQEALAEKLNTTRQARLANGKIIKVILKQKSCLCLVTSLECLLIVYLKKIQSR